MGTQINELTAASAAIAGMSIPVYDPSNGDTRRISLTTLLAYMQAALTFPSARGAFTTQYYAPAASPFTVTVTDGDEDDECVHLLLTPTGVMAVGTITFPLLASLADKQEILISTTQQVTALTLAGNGATILGWTNGTQLNQYGYLRFKFDDTLGTWYRIG